MTNGEHVRVGTIKAGTRTSSLPLGVSDLEEWQEAVSLILLAQH
ncbi:hypothetical protein [Nostoc sp. C110]